MSTEPATPSPEADLPIDQRLALMLIRRAMVSEDAALDDARAILSFLASADSEPERSIPVVTDDEMRPNPPYVIDDGYGGLRLITQQWLDGDPPATPSPGPQECSSLSSAEETWISEAVIALTYTPIDPARLFQWPGHSGLTLDSEQARDAALRVLSHMQDKSIPTPAAPSSSGETQRVEVSNDDVADAVADCLRCEAPQWDPMPPCWNCGWGRFTSHSHTPAASGEAQDPPEAEMVQVPRAEWDALVVAHDAACAVTTPHTGLPLMPGTADAARSALVGAAHRLVRAATPAGGEGTA